MLRKPGAPWHAINDASTYTDAGRRYLRRTFACVVGFLACWALAVGIGVVTESFKN
jgi:hypothetical protein